MCRQCGAPVTNLVCEYCGTLRELPKTAANEREALKEFHDILMRQEKKERIKLMKHGYLPDSPDVLVMSGMRMLTLIDTENPADEAVEAAVTRLKAILAKLRASPEEDKQQKAIDEFEQALAEYDIASKKLNKGCTYWSIGIAIFIVVILVILSS
jgi:lipid II:glycine glycyltransferase (peptidoglycan interpeptide bridge formation enzyme)